MNNLLILLYLRNAARFIHIDDNSLWRTSCSELGRKLYNGCLDLSANLLIGNMVLVRNVTWPLIASHLKGQFLFSTSAVKVHDSQAYRNIGMIREPISFTFDPYTFGYVFIALDWLQLCKSCSGLCNPWENLWFGAIIWDNCSEVHEACTVPRLCP